MSRFEPAPLATYRVQLSGDFTFADATAIVPYLGRLGISHLYCSPYLKARPGSAHGYDIVDHNSLNPEIGDEDGFGALCDALAAAGMGHILDFVPNHMGIGEADNAWWLDVLEWGRESPYAEYFDIDWEPAKVELRGKVLVPSLGDHYGKILENGELALKFDADEGKFSVWYYGHRFPIVPAHYAPILTDALRRLGEGGELDEQRLVELDLLAAGFRDLRRTARSARQRSFRRSKAEKLVAQLKELARDSKVREAVDAAVDGYNGESGNPRSFEKLHRLLEAQHYRLAFWRVAAEEINYRRFFQINDLAGIRVEAPQVFDDVHRLVLRLIGEGRLQGLRIDHIDGLFDPLGYLTRLQEKIRGVRAAHAGSQAANADAGGSAGAGAESPLFYVVVEKILAHHEKLRDDWPIAGTTGYDFLNRLNGVFVEPDGEEPLTRIYHRFIGETLDFERICLDAKKQAMDEELASELRVLANEFNRMTEGSWLTRDYTLVGLREALRQIVACFPVYRTYIDRHGASAEDVRDIEWALALANKVSTRADKTVFDFIRQVLMLTLSQRRSIGIRRREVQRLAMKFQQYTGPVMAKGIEDTAFYRYCCLTSLNEVGGEPTRFGTSVAAFHHRNQEQLRRWPLGMICTSTHDTKRGEDVRARINVLSELPHEWARSVRRWATLNCRRKAALEDGPAPSANDEYLFYQALVGAWPLELHTDQELDAAVLADFRGRMTAYMLKASREGKSHTSWINADPDYENGLTAFVERVLDAERPSPFLSDFRQFHRRVALLGMLNGLAQTVLKLTVPGMPDLYQGTELWDLSLVDPDNRRPVDFAARSRMVDRLEEMMRASTGEACSQLLEQWSDGMVKLFVVWRLLTLRGRRSALFHEGGYLAVEASGAQAEHLVCFARTQKDTSLLVCVPRLVARLATETPPYAAGDAVWRDTVLTLPDDLARRTWRNVFTGELVDPAAAAEGAAASAAAAEGKADQGQRIPAASLLSTFPVAVLEPA